MLITFASTQLVYIEYRAAIIR